MWNNIFHFVRIIPVEELKPFWEEATEIMGAIDGEDVPFVAAALSQDSAVIWSDDKHFDQQQKVMNLKTADMVKLFRRED